MAKKANRPKMPARVQNYDPEYALCDTWRVRSSSIPEIELSYIQQDVQGFVDVLCGGKYKVLWKGQDKVPGFTEIDKPIIYISYGPVKGQAPADSWRVDVLAGIGVHEAGHTKLKDLRGVAFNGRVANILEDAWIDYRTGRDFKVLGKYIDRTREYYKGNHDEQIKWRLDQPKPLGRNEIQDLWSSIALYGMDEIFDWLEWRTAPDIGYVKHCITALMRITLNAIEKLDTDRTTYAQLVRAATTALDNYERDTASLMEQYKEEQAAADIGGEPEQEGFGSSVAGKPDWGADEEIDNSIPKGESDDDEEGEDSDEEQGETQAGSAKGDGDEEEEGDGDSDLFGDEDKPETMHSHLPVKQSGRANQDQEEPEDLEPSVCADDFMEAMDIDLASLVWEATEQEAEDISSIVNDRGFILRKPPLGNPIHISDRHAEEIKQAFETRKSVFTYKYPYQESGRVCRRTLPDLVAKGSKLIFEEEVDEDEIDVALGILVDASGSIGTGGHWNPFTRQYEVGKGQWEMIMDTSQMCVDAFREGGLDLHIMAYTSRVAWRLYEPGWEHMRTGGVHPSGGTPSVPGIKALAYRMNKLSGHRRDKIIVHMTDGEPNEGGGADAMHKQVNELERKGYRIIGIGAGVPEAALERQYSRYFCITDFVEVPARMRQILEKM